MRALDADRDRPLHAAPRIVVVEDDKPFREVLTEALQGAGFRVTPFASAEVALSAVRADPPHVVLTDLYLAGQATGLDVLQGVHAVDSELPVVLMTARGDIRTAIDAMKHGAFHFAEKPFPIDEAVMLLTRAAEQRTLVLENRLLKTRLSFTSGLERVLVGRSAAMTAMRELLLKIAPTPANVIVIGETGTGKELIARCLHEFSGRRGRFVAVNCAAVPESLFESELFGHEQGAFTGAGKQRIGKVEYAQGGTLLLDEIESMPLHLQAKMLRMLQEREVERLGGNKAIPVDVRIVAATKEDLGVSSQQGKFRSDLYYRLNVATVSVPPLRRRREDVPELFQHFIHDIALRTGQVPADVPPSFCQRLLAHDWPGNVRELRNAAEQYQFGIPLSIDAKAVAASRCSLDEILGLVEKTLIEGALRRHEGNASAACTELGINYSMLYRRMKAYGMELTDFRGSSPNVEEP